eukprot:INCI16151.1.p1 GENE.INCI16151.1~~INCI16151.1.p1  ORF type:complete len:1333 (-),score=222.74 INCI16151.1:203-4201(-)
MSATSGSRKSVSLQRLEALQGDERRIRNICILAHVDHGKTTLADTLVASNGIISMRSAGEVRYMDSTEEEQRRGITMKSSSIALLYNCPRRIIAQKDTERQQELQRELKKDAEYADAAATAALGAGRGRDRGRGRGRGRGIGRGRGRGRGRVEALRRRRQRQQELKLERQRRLMRERKIADLQALVSRPPVQAYDFDPPNVFTHLVNIIDSPGHVDFSCDVATAIRNCDGALVVVDVVEGLCVQTQAVIKQGFEEKLRPVLVLNKIDRLVLELELTPPEAYDHLVRLLEQINTVMGSLYSSRVMANVSADDNRTGAAQDGGNGEGSAALEMDEMDEDRHYFSPANGNVVFASAKDGWAFTLDHFARMLSAEADCPLACLGLPKKALRRILWDDFYFQAKTRKLLLRPHKTAPRRVAERFVLARIWRLYKLVHAGKPAEAVEACCRLAGPSGSSDGGGGSSGSASNVSGAAHQQLKAQAASGALDKLTPQNAVKRIGQAWLPAADAILTAVCRQIPSPREAMTERIDAVLPQLRGLQSVAGTKVEATEENSSTVTPRAAVLALRSAVRECDVSSGESLAFVSKMFACPAEMLPPSSRFYPQADDGGSVPSNTMKQPVFLGFARVFGGVLDPSCFLHVLLPRWDPLRPNDEHTRRLPRYSLELYVMMGRDLIPIDKAPAGNVVAIAGLHHFVHKSATLSTSRNCPSMARLNFQAMPIVQVAVEPESLDDLEQLEAGLRLLNQADLAVGLIRARTGENILVTLGELHLKHCEEQLRATYARVPFRFSEPIVRFQETLPQDWIPATVTDILHNRNAACHGDAGSAVDSTNGSSCVQEPTSTEPESRRFDALSAASSRGERDRLIAEEQHTAAAAHAASETAAGVPGAATTITSGKDLAFTVSVLAMPRALLHFLEQRHESPFVTARSLVTWTMDYSVAGSTSGSDTSATNGDSPGLDNTGTGDSYKLDTEADGGSEGDSVMQELRDEYFAVLDSLMATCKAPGPTGKDWVRRYLPHVFSMSVQDLGGCNLMCSLVEEGAVTGETGALGLQAVPLARVKSGASNGSVGSSGSRVSSTTDATAVAADESLDMALAQQVVAVHGSNIRTGFKMACEHGPLCEEPVRGVVYLLHHIDSPNAAALAHAASRSADATSEVTAAAGISSTLAVLPSSTLRSGALGGQVIAAVTLCCRRALASSSPRLVEPMYACNLQCEQGLLGPFYEVLRRRRAQIVDEDLIEGTSTFSINALLPVIESFGMADELRDMTSGASTSDTQLVLHGWRIIKQDPYFKPATEDELEEFGATGGTVVNYAKTLVDRIRLRKGTLIVPGPATLLHEH